jgi:intracellular sulfur oxidation DsrE/DsrF family protein
MLGIGFQLIIVSVFAQTKPVKIVFDLTSKDTLTQQTALRHITMMAESYPQSTFELVIYGGALNMVVKGKSTMAKSIEKITVNPKVSIKVCEYAMKRYGVDQSQLLPGVGTVPDGILEIVTRQNEGWGYIKEANN